MKLWWRRKNRKLTHDEKAEIGKVEDALRKSPINYFSDLFITAMVLLWIFDNVYQSLVASAVTISSIVLSFQSGIPTFDTSMWSSIGSNVAIPLSCGGAIWMIKNSVQHAIAYSKGRQAYKDFPKVDIDNYEVETNEESIELDDVGCSMDSNAASEIDPES